MEVNINFDTKRKMIIKLFRHKEGDDFCLIFMLKKAWHLRFLWFKLELNIPDKWRPDDED